MSLLAGLLSSSGYAQQESAETPGKTPTIPSSKIESDPELQTGKTQKKAPEASPPTTRFVPREKIHADDAVSFPVDI
jgi:hypothetical protein